MNRLEYHVEHLFRKYKETAKIKEMKIEIFGNLEAKVADLISSGMAESSAIDVAIESLKSVDWLQEENVEIYINQYQLEYAQHVLLYFLTGWIFTIPLSIIGSGRFLSLLLFLGSAAAGVTYWVMGGKRNTPDFQKKGFVNLPNAKKRRNLIWILWSLFMLVSTASVTALRFGSNLWFSRPIHIDGPYQFAIIAVRYLLPLFTVLVPLCISIAPRLIMKYQTGDLNENEK